CAIDLFSLNIHPPTRSLHIPYTTLFRSNENQSGGKITDTARPPRHYPLVDLVLGCFLVCFAFALILMAFKSAEYADDHAKQNKRSEDTRLNSSHQIISYAVFCLKKKDLQ